MPKKIFIQKLEGTRLRGRPRRGSKKRAKNNVISWKSGRNRELVEVRKGENIVKWIKGQWINWLGHLEGMEEDRLPKKIFIQKLEGTRLRGRPRKGWKEVVKKEIFKC